MLFTRALIASGLLAMMLLPAQCEEGAKGNSGVNSTKELNKEEKAHKKELRKEQEKESKNEESSEKAAEKTEKSAEVKASEAQARERNLPKHEDHHKLGATKQVDKGFDFGTSNSK